MKKGIIFLFLVLSAAFGLFAETINLEQVRSLALGNSRVLMQHNLTIHGIELDARSLLYSNLPSLSLGASASMNLWSPTGAAPIENPFDTFSAGASVSVSQRIFEGGRSVIQRAINEIASQSARNDALAEFFSVLDAADNAYYAVLEAQAALMAEEASLAAALTSLEIAEIRLAGGMINRGDFLRALAEKEARENARNQARRNLSLNIARLRTLTGLGTISQLEPVQFDRYEDLIERLGTISDEGIDVLFNQFWGQFALRNPSLSRAHLMHQRSEQNLSLARTAFFPSLGASFSTGLNYRPGSGLELSGGRVSLSASIPVDYWVLANNVERSRLVRDSAALDRLNAQFHLETEIFSALLNTIANAGTFLSSRRSLEFSEQHYQFVAERHRLAHASITEYGEAATLLINSRNSHIRASYGFLQSLSRLRSLGAIDDEEKLLNFFLENLP